MDRMAAAATDPWQKVYVGALTRVEPHPNADGEVIAEVDAGWSRLTVVTGGPNVAVGTKVAVAHPGARVFDATSPVPRTRKLKQRRIRGVLSEGLLRSPKELGLCDDHSSLFVVDPDAPVGQLIGDAVSEQKAAKRVNARSRTVAESAT